MAVAPSASTTSTIDLARLGPVEHVREHKPACAVPVLPTVAPRSGGVRLRPQRRSAWRSPRAARACTPVTTTWSTSSAVTPGLLQRVTDGPLGQRHVDASRRTAPPTTCDAALAGDPPAVEELVGGVRWPDRPKPDRFVFAHHERGVRH